MANFYIISLTLFLGDNAMIGKILAKIRETKNLSKTDLAKMTDIKIHWLTDSSSLCSVDYCYANFTLICVYREHLKKTLHLLNRQREGFIPFYERLWLPTF